MKKTANKNAQGLLLHTELNPVTPRDTFMACISFWRHGNLAHRREIRRSLMRCLARQCFGVKKLHNVTPLYLADRLRLRCKLFASVEDAYAFLMANQYEGVVTDRKIMCQAVAWHFGVDVRLDGNIFHPSNGAGKIDTIFLRYTMGKRAFKLLIPNLPSKTKMTTTYELLEQIDQDEWKSAGHMARKDIVHELTVTPRKTNSLCVVYPTGHCYHVARVYVFVSVHHMNHFVLTAMAEGAENPYFFLEKEDVAYDVVAVTAESKEAAKAALRLRNKENEYL
jgi:hypothetical protein